MPEIVLVRPRLPCLLATAVDGALGLAVGAVGRRSTGLPRVALTAAGIGLATVGPAAFWYWTRTREVRFDGDGVRLRGLGLSVSLPWSEVGFVRAERIGPTTFLVAEARPTHRFPLLTPFRNRLAGSLGVSDPATLLVLRTADFPDGARSFADALAATAPPSVPVDWPG